LGYRFGFIFAIIPILIILSIVSWIAYAYLEALFGIFALRKAGLPAIKIDFMAILRLMALGIVEFIFGVFCRYNLVFLSVLIAAIITLAIGVFFPPLLIVSILLFCVFLVIFVYNMIRLCLSARIF